MALLESMRKVVSLGFALHQLGQDLWETLLVLLCLDFLSALFIFLPILCLSLVYHILFLVLVCFVTKSLHLLLSLFLLVQVISLFLPILVVSLFIFALLQLFLPVLPVILLSQPPALFLFLMIHDLQFHQLVFQFPQTNLLLVILWLYLHYLPFKLQFLLS